MSNNYKINPNELLKDVKELFIVDLLEHALKLSSGMLKIFKDPDPGIYIKSVKDPVLLPDKKYYPKNNYLIDQYLIKTHDDVINSLDDIVDENCNLVIKKEFIASRKYLILKKPDIPVVIMDFIRVVIQNYIDSLCIYSRSVGKFSVFSFIKPKYHELIENGEFDELCETEFEELYNLVYDFIGNDKWHIYFYRVKGNLLIVEKVCDYRIYWYHKYHDNKDNDYENINYN